MKHRRCILQLAVLLLTLFFYLSAGYCDNPFTVFTIYFKPTDAPALAKERDNISKFVTEAQQKYTEELSRHGFGEKTFRLQSDEKGSIIIHTVRGTHNATHYVQDTWKKVLADLPDRFNPNTSPWEKQDAIRLVIIGGIKFVNGNKWGIGFPRHSNRYGGSCYIAGGSNAFNANLIFHELGHCFGLYHKPEGKPFELAHYEARWLSKHYHFNTNVNTFTFPKIVKNKPILTHIGNNFIRFEIDAESNFGLHQAKIFRDADIVVIAYDYLNGRKKDKITLQAPKRYWHENMKLTLMDNNGNYAIHTFQLNLKTLKNIENTDKK